MWGAYRGVVDHDVQAAEPGQGLRQQLLQGGPVAHIGQQRQGLAAQGRNFRRHRLRIGRVGTGIHRHIRAAGGQRQGNGPANVASRAGNQRRLSR